MTRCHRNEAGAILVLTSLLALTLLTFTAYAVDIGHESEVKRHLHVVADVAAQDALHGLGTSSALTDVANLATASARANGHPLTGSNHLTVEIGQWAGTPRSFKSFNPACVVTLPASTPPCSTAASANADRIVASSTVIWNFVSGSQGLSAAAVARPAGETGLEISSYDASISLTTGQQAFLNSALGVSAVSYEGLAGANIKVGDLATQLGFGSVDSFLNGSTTYGQLLSAGARALANQGDTTAAANMAGIAAALSSGGTSNVKSGSTLSMSRFLKRSVSSNGAGSFGEGSLLAGSGGVDALGLVTSGFDAALIDSRAFARLSGLNLSIPNVASIDAGVKVISGPGGPDFGAECDVTTQEPGALAACAQVNTSQIEAQIIAHLAPVVVPIPSLGNATISANIPLYFDNAAAHAWISFINCSSPADFQASVDAWIRTGLAHVAIGQNAALTAATGQQDLSNGLAGSIGVIGPDGSTVNVSGATFAEISIPALQLDAKVANNGTVTVLSSGPSLLQPSPAPNPAVPSYSGPFQKPMGAQTYGYRGPDNATAATLAAGAGVTAVNPTGNALQDALTSLANSVPNLQAQLDLQLGGSAARATVDLALGSALSQEATTINSVISSLGQTVFAPLAAAFQTDIGGAIVTNLTARDQTPPDGTVCIPSVVQ